MFLAYIVLFGLVCVYLCSILDVVLSIFELLTIFGRSWFIIASTCQVIDREDRLQYDLMCYLGR